MRDGTETGGWCGSRASRSLPSTRTRTTPTPARRWAGIGREEQRHRAAQYAGGPEAPQDARDLPPAFGSWAATGIANPDPQELDARLDAGQCGLCLPAGALAGGAQIDRLAPLLDRLEQRDAPLLVHPGAASEHAQAPDPRTPGWWPALTRYVTDMSHAWHAFIVFARPQHPDLRVAFVMLAGLGPLHLERLTARGGPAEIAIDQDVFFDTSSYGPQAIDAMVRAQGIDQIVYGSDRPVVEPRTWTHGDAARHATLVTNPARLLGSAAPA